MKQQNPGTQYVPSYRTLSDVNTLQERYLRSMTDCEVKTDSDRWYMATIFSCCVGLIFPPCFLVAIYCLAKAKKNRKGGKQ